MSSYCMFLGTMDREALATGVSSTLGCTLDCLFNIVCVEYRRTEHSVAAFFLITGLKSRNPDPDYWTSGLIGIRPLDRIGDVHLQP